MFHRRSRAHLHADGPLRLLAKVLARRVTRFWLVARPEAAIRSGPGFYAGPGPLRPIKNSAVVGFLLRLAGYDNSAAQAAC
jgi:hypothetical protein